MSPISFITASELAEVAQGAFSFIAPEEDSCCTVQYHYSSGKLRTREIVATYNFHGYPGRATIATLAGGAA